MVSRYGKNSNSEPHKAHADDAIRLIDVGDLHFEASAYTSALEYYSKLLDSNYCENLQPSLSLSVFCKAIDSTLRIGDLTLATSLIEQAFQLLSDSGEALSEQEHALLLGRRASLFIQLGNYVDALKISKHAFAILAVSDNHVDVANLQMTMGVCHHRLGRLAKAEEFYYDAASTFRRVGDEIGIAISQNNIALIQKNACNWEKAVQLQKQAIATAEHHGAAHLLSRFQLNMGIIQRKVGSFSEARLSLGNSLRLAKSLGDASRQAKNCLALGYLELQEGHLLRAEELVMEGKLLSEQAGFRRETTIADEYLGDILLARGEVDAALYSFGLGLDRAQSVGTVTDLEGELLRRCADAHIFAKDWDRAIEAANAAMAVCSSCGEVYELGFCNRSLGIANKAIGNLEGADEGFIASIEIFIDQNLPIEACRSLNAFIRHRINNADLELLKLMRRHLVKLIDDYDTSHDEKLFIELQHDMAEIQLKLEEYDEALLAVAELERIITATGENASTLSIADLRGRIESRMMSSSMKPGESFGLLGDNITAMFKGDGAVAGNLTSVLNACIERSGASVGFIAIDIPDAKGTLLKTAASEGLPGNQASELSSWYKESCDFDSNSSLLLSSVSSHDFSGTPVKDMMASFSSCTFIPVSSRDNFKGLLFLAMKQTDAGEGQFRSSSLEFIYAYMGFLGMFLQERTNGGVDSGSVPKPVAGIDSFENVITGDEKMLELLGLAQKVADSDLTVLLQGETGTGKGLIAYAIHALSNRSSNKFMSINCAAIPESLIESELFGHLKGSFTGASGDKKGLLAEAEGGTIFLDEINKLPVSMQGKLLQFLDGHKVRQIGSTQEKTIDVRIICASKGDLKQQAESAFFLEDLYYRISDFPLYIPPLRDRHKDIRLLAHHFITRFARETQVDVPGYTPSFMDALVSYGWPGNVRELEKCIKRAMVLMRSGDTLHQEHLPANVAESGRGSVDGDLITPLRETLGEVECREISRALKRTGGNKSQASRILGISYPNLLKKIRLYGLIRR